MLKEVARAARYPGTDRSGPDRLGSDRAGIDRPGIDRLGIDRPGIEIEGRGWPTLSSALLSLLEDGTGREGPEVRGLDISRAESDGWSEAMCRLVIEQTKRLIPAATICVLTYQPDTYKVFGCLCSSDASPEVVDYCTSVLASPQLLVTAGLGQNGLFSSVPDLRSALARAKCPSPPDELRAENAVVCGAQCWPNLNLLIWAWKPRLYGDFCKLDSEVLREVNRLLALRLKLAMLRDRYLGSLLGNILDQSDSVLMVTDEHLRLNSANKLAADFLRTGEYFTQVNDRLVLPDSIADSRFRQHVQHLLDNVSSGGPLSINVPLQSKNGSSLLRVAVTVLRSQADSILGPPILSITAAVRDRTSGVTVEQLTKIGLTKAEADLAVALLKGKTVKQYAVLRKVAVATARAHLKRAMMRLGVHRQADLVRTLLEMF